MKRYNRTNFKWDLLYGLIPLAIFFGIFLVFLHFVALVVWAFQN
jgi:hypothetical protein